MKTKNIITYIKKDIKQLVIILILLQFFLFSCKSSHSTLSSNSTTLNKNMTGGYISNNSSGENENSYGTVFFDASKRNAVSTIYNNKEVITKYLSEIKPKTISLLIEKITSKINQKSNKEQISAMSDLTNTLKQAISQTEINSKSLSYLTISLYRLNESYYNNALDSIYAKLYLKVLDNAKEIQLAELKNTK